jgi:lipoprotein-releasing system permease protein
MYKLLLCWRYLRTRYIALASIISVMLGVATMIVVNSVMEGFSSEMQNRIHGILSDVIVESQSFEGMPHADWQQERIHKLLGDDVEAMSPTVAVPAMVNLQCGGRSITKPVQLIGIDAKTQGQVSDFSRYLQHPANREAMSFDLRDGGYDTHDHQSGAEAPDRPQLATAGGEYRRESARIKKFQEQYRTSAAAQRPAPTARDAASPKNTAKDAPAAATPGIDPFASHQPAENIFDPEKQTHTGIVLGIAMASFRTAKGEDLFYAIPGDDVIVVTATVGDRPQASPDHFTIVDFYESKMSEYDSQFVFVPIRKLQELRGMIDRESGDGNVNAIQIKLKPGVDPNAVRDRLRAAFEPQLFGVYTWRDKQGPLLAAVDMEKATLNVLLFLIIAVAGFGILAIFYMIVVEKTRDIGILKSLGAPGRGVMGIFLGYGLSLGLVGSGVGTIIGLLFVRYINEIAAALGWITGHEVFPPSVYYFYKIPAIVVPQTIAWIVAGALCIAVAASILPARRAAGLHPVEALRYE